MTTAFPLLFLLLFALGVLLHPDWNCLHPTACKALTRSRVPAPEILTFPLNKDCFIGIQLLNFYRFCQIFTKCFIDLHKLSKKVSTRKLIPANFLRYPVLNLA